VTWFDSKLWAINCGAWEVEPRKSKKLQVGVDYGKGLRQRFHHLGSWGTLQAPRWGPGQILNQQELIWVLLCFWMTSDLLFSSHFCVTHLKPGGPNSLNCLKSRFLCYCCWSTEPSVKGGDIALNGKLISELQSVTCHMGSHSVTCHPTQVNVPRRNPSQIGWYSIYLPRGMEG